MAVDHQLSFARSMALIHSNPENEGRKRSSSSNSSSSNNINRRRRRATLSPTSTSGFVCEFGGLAKLPFSPSTDGKLQKERGSSLERPSKKTLQRRRRATTVTFAPLPPSHRSSSPAPCATVDESTNDVSSDHEDETTPAHEEQYKGFRQDYSVGETLRSPSHLVAEPTSQEAVNSLQKHDFAFIKRSDGSYTYAILACIDGDEEERMTFVLHENGSTKVIRKKYWKKLICLVSTDDV